MTRAGRGAWALALVLLTVAGAALGFTVTRAAAAPRPAPIAGLTTLAHVGPAVLARPQRSVDLDQAPAGAGLMRSSIRRLAVTPDVPTVVVAGRTRSGRICLVGASRAGTAYAASCVAPSAFASRGITLQWSLSGWSTGSPYVEQGYLIRFITLVWGPDDALRFRMRVQGEE